MTEQQLLRMAKRHLAILRLAEEVTGHVALTCRYDGISRAGVLHLAPALRPAWLRRARGPLPAPQVSPTPPAPRSSARSSTWPALQAPRPPLTALREAAARPPPADRREVPHPLPGSRRKHYQCIAIEDCTRLHVLRIYPQLNQGYRRIHGQLCHLGTRTGLRPAPCGPPCSALVLIQHLSGRRSLGGSSCNPRPPVCWPWTSSLWTRSCCCGCICCSRLIRTSAAAVGAGGVRRSLQPAPFAPCLGPRVSGRVRRVGCRPAG